MSRSPRSPHDPALSTHGWRHCLFLALWTVTACVGNVVEPSGVDLAQPPDPVRRGDAGGADAGRRGSDGGVIVPVGPGIAADAAVAVPSSGAMAKSYKVDKGVLYDGCGEQVVLMGINHPTMYTDRAGKAMAQIAQSGANTVRLFWYAQNGEAITEAEEAIEAAVDNGMIPMLEMHDSTCKWELEPILDYWTSPDAVALIKRHERHILVNIANEANPPDGASFKEGYGDAVTRLREAGIHVPLVIDAGRCGRDYDMVLDNGQALVEQDPDHNLIFSAHLYDPLSQHQYGDMFDKARERELAFIVGELAHRQPPGCGAELDYKSMLREAERTETGWIAWSWGDDDAATNWNTDCGEFDMTSTFAFDSLQGWGKEVAVSLPESLLNLSLRPHALTHGDKCE